jgi:hypothetical protein
MQSLHYVQVNAVWPSMIVLPTLHGGVSHLICVVDLIALASALIMLASAIALASSPSLCWNHHPHCAIVATLVALVLLPLLHWCCIFCSMVYHIIRGLVHASSTRAKMPTNQLHDASNGNGNGEGNGNRLIFILCGTVFYGTVAKIIFQVFNIST